MKIKKLHLWFTLGVVLGAFLGSLFYVSNLGEPENKAIAFVTLGVDPIVGENSSYELHRAAEHFSHIVLGWTIEPAFVTEMGGEYGFSAQRQEKQSMLFEVTGASVLDTVPAEQMLDLVKQRIEEYNDAAGAEYVVAVERFSFLEGERSEWRIIAGVTILSLVFVVLLLMIFENLYASRYRSSYTS